MNIYAEEDTKVKFTGCSESQRKWGSYDGNWDDLKEGEIYTIDYTDVHSSHTRVYLKGYKGCFNSVCFEDIT